MDRNLYLSNLDLEDARSLLLEVYKTHIENFGMERITLDQALGRVSAEPIFALASSPFGNVAAMDGIAVVSEATADASENNPIILEREKDFIYINTGNLIPNKFDAVIMIEEVNELSAGKKETENENNQHCKECVEIIKAAAPWQDIRPIGEDIVEGEMIVPAGTELSPGDIGALISGGHWEINVYKKPVVALIPTGSEIIEAGSPKQQGKVFDSNTRVFEALLQQYGATSVRFGIIKDEPDALLAAFKEGAQKADVLVVNAGSSAGTKDFTAWILKQEGKIYAHGVAIKPGKPVMFGEIFGKPFIGIPGYPVSAYLTFDIFVQELVMAMQRKTLKKAATVKAILSRRLVSSIKHIEFVRMKLGMVDGKVICSPLSRGAGSSMSLSRADGILIVPKNLEGIEAGESVEIRLSKPIENIASTLVAIGSHDLILDVLGNLLHKQNRNSGISSAHVGSMGGIMALKRREAHFAPIHLLDEETGEYNLSYIEKYLGTVGFSLIKGVQRVQGLMVKKGNPLDIKSIHDIFEKKASYVNRQRGAGTRLLFDFMLKKEGITEDGIMGYNREMTTHMAVAAAVAGGNGDVGMGVESAANIMGLDFIPLGVEDYDFAIPTEYLGMEEVKALLEVMKSEEFKLELEKLRGYLIKNPGEICTVETKNRDMRG